MVWECIVQHSFMRHNNIVQHHDCNDKYFYCVCKWNNSHLIILHWLHPTFMIRSKSWDFLQLIWSLLKIASVKKVNNWDKMLKLKLGLRRRLQNWIWIPKPLLGCHLLTRSFVQKRYSSTNNDFASRLSFQLVLFCLEPQLVVL